MKIRAKTLLIVAAVSLPALTAYAGTVLPAKNASARIESNGHSSVVTKLTKIRPGDRITAQQGPIRVSYGECVQTIPKNHYLIIPADKKCGVIKSINSATNQVENVAKTSTTAGTHATASIFTTGKILAIGAVAAGAAIIADNKKSSPN